MDNETKNIIIKNIKKYLKEKTVIIITNQEDLMKLCDNIFVIENGIIIQNGNYEELTKDKNNFFCNLIVNNYK